MNARNLAGRKAPSQDASADPAANRLRRLAGLDNREPITVGAQTRQLPIRSELVTQGQGIGAVMALQSGWAAHVELFPDGRRQIVHLVLPGEIVGYPRAGRTLSVTTVIALSPVRISTWDVNDQPQLAACQLAALTVSDALDFVCMSNQIARIGRRSAYERLAHLLLEIGDRLALAGISTQRTFAMPLTQEMLADVLGITNVHVNRTVQQLRAEDQIQINRGVVEITDPAMLMKIVGYQRLSQFLST
jgi:CRP-like cAMP-binding protein